ISMPQTTYTKDALPKIFRDFAGKRLVFDTALMNPDIQERVTIEVAEVKAKFSIYERIEMKEDGSESYKGYMDRVFNEDPSMIRGMDESAHTHAVRCVTP